MPIISHTPERGGPAPRSPKPEPPHPHPTQTAFLAQDNAKRPGLAISIFKLSSSV